MCPGAHYPHFNQHACAADSGEQPRSAVVNILRRLIIGQHGDDDLCILGELARCGRCRGASFTGEGSRAFQVAIPDYDFVTGAHEIERHWPPHAAEAGKSDPHQAAALPLPLPIPEIAWTRLSSLTSLEVNSRVMRPWYIATTRSETPRISGISEEMTITA